MKVKIFFVIIAKAYDRTKEIETRINKFLEEHPGATVQWIQSTGGATGGGSAHVATTITAIINY